MTNPSQQIMRLGLGFAVSQALRVMIELRIPDLLADGARSVDDLATATQSDADALYRVMRLLAPEGVFNEIATRQFKLTEVGAVLRSDHSGPSDFIRMINSEAYLAFEQLLHSVRTGKPAFDKVFGSPRFDWLSKHPEQAALFQRAMVALGHPATRRLPKPMTSARSRGSWTLVAGMGSFSRKSWRAIHI